MHTRQSPAKAVDCGYARRYEQFKKTLLFTDSSFL